MFPIHETYLRKESFQFLTQTINLLAPQVSLYQILPKKSQLESAERRQLPVAHKTNHNGSGENDDDTQSKGFESSGLDKEFPLRLLDIRRIDLDTSGWETFYVKRAVEDWISDESSNLGKFVVRKRVSPPLYFTDEGHHHHHHFACPPAR